MQLQMGFCNREQLRMPESLSQALCSSATLEGTVPSPAPAGIPHPSGCVLVVQNLADRRGKRVLGVALQDQGGIWPSDITKWSSAGSHLWKTAPCCLSAKPAVQRASCYNGALNVLRMSLKEGEGLLSVLASPKNSGHVYYGQLENNDLRC